MKIAIVGGQCAGKTTVSDILFDHMEYEEQFSTIVTKFAWPIYETLHALKQEKHRGFMQEFSDLAKEYFGDGIFRDIFSGAVERHNKLGFHVLCDDLRYIEEEKVCRKLGFKVIAVTAPREVRKDRAERLGLEFKENHSSEVQVDDIISRADVVIDNTDAPKELLEEMVIEAIKQLKRGER